MIGFLTLWQSMSRIRLRTYAAGWQVPIIDGQSLALGVNPTVAQRAWANYRRRSALRMVLGLRRADNAVSHLHGNGALGYSEADHATGLGYAVAAANVPSCFTFAAALDLWRAKMGLPLRRMLVGFNGMAGQSVTEFDKPGLIRDNHARWLTEALTVAPGLSPIVYARKQGEADVSMAAGAWLPLADKADADALDDIQSITGTRPPLMVWQTGGYRNTVGDAYGVALDQLVQAQRPGVIFAGPLYPFQVADTVHHTWESQIIVDEIAARVFALREAGTNANLLPGVPEWQGNTVRIPFTCAALAFDPVDRYAGQGGLVNHGVEAAGANIVSVTLDGNAVVVTCDGPMTQVQIAMQSADMSAHSYVAHRCDIMESGPVDSLMLPGVPLKRFIPSCRFVRP